MLEVSVNLHTCCRGCLFASSQTGFAHELVCDGCREGRQLVYDLSATHRSSLLLNYAMQKILRAGHEEEVR